MALIKTMLLTGVVIATVVAASNFASGHWDSVLFVVAGSGLVLHTVKQRFFS